MAEIRKPFGLPALGEPDETPAAASQSDGKEQDAQVGLADQNPSPPRVTEPTHATKGPGYRARPPANRGQMADDSAGATPLLWAPIVAARRGAARLGSARQGNGLIRRR